MTRQENEAQYNRLRDQLNTALVKVKLFEDSKRQVERDLVDAEEDAEMVGTMLDKYKARLVRDGAEFDEDGKIVKVFKPIRDEALEEAYNDNTVPAKGGLVDLSV